jgi:hypothetical protein
VQREVRFGSEADVRMEQRLCPLSARIEHSPGAVVPLLVPTVLKSKVASWWGGTFRGGADTHVSLDPDERLSMVIVAINASMQFLTYLILAGSASV